MSHIIDAELYDAGTNEEYHAGDGVSNSQLSVLIGDPAEYGGLFVDGSIEKSPPTPQMLVGTYLHELVLEGEIQSGMLIPEGKTVVTADKKRELESKVRVVTCVPNEVLDQSGYRKGNVYKVWSARFPKTTTKFVKEAEYQEMQQRVADAFIPPDGVTMIDNDTIDQLHGMRDSIRGHAFASKLLFGEGESEVPIRGTDAGSGVLCRCKVDRASLDSDRPFVVDLKTTMDASPRGFANSVAKFGYHRQQVFYSRLITAVCARDVDFWFVVVAKKPPHRVEVYQLEPTWIERGVKEVDAGLREFDRCQRSGVWQHEHHGEALVLPMPRYVNYQDEWEVN